MKPIRLTDVPEKYSYLLKKPAEILWTSGSQSTLRESRGIRDQFPGDLLIHFCNVYLEGYFI